MEQRKYPRFSVQFHSSFSSINVVSGEGNVSDLSIRGCRVDSSIEVKPGTALQVRMDVSSNEPPIHVTQAVVRWHRNGNFGMEFVSMTPDEWARLQRVVKELELEPYQREHRQNQVA